MTLPQQEYHLLIDVASLLGIHIDQLCRPVLTQYGADGMYISGKYQTADCRWRYKLNISTQVILFQSQEE